LAAVLQNALIGIHKISQFYFPLDVTDTVCLANGDTNCTPLTKCFIAEPHFLYTTTNITSQDVIKMEYFMVLNDEDVA
jgi:hypothetical protein